MSFVQPPRKRKCYLVNNNNNIITKSEPSPDSPSSDNSLVIASPQILTTSTAPQTIALPADEQFAAFIKHALELATLKNGREQILSQEREALALKLNTTEEKLRNLQQQLIINANNNPSLSPKSSPTSTTLIEEKAEGNNNSHHQLVDPRASKLEQKNRELQRNLDLVQRDLASCSGTLKNVQADCSKKEALLLENTREIDRLRGELTQTRSRLDAFFKSASEQAILAKSLQEELGQEKEARQQVEAKLRSANECVMLGMQFEARLKTITSEKLEIEAELSKVRAENLRLVASYGAAEKAAAEQKAAVKDHLAAGVESRSVSVQTEEVIAKERFIKSDEEIVRLQNEIDGLQHQLQIVMCADTKFYDQQQVDTLTPSSSSSAPAVETSSSEVPSSPTQLQTEISTLKRRVAELLDELEKRKATMEYHHKTWTQKCEQVTRLEDKVRDRDIQCAKYHYELELADKRIRTLSDRIFRYDNCSSNSSPSLTVVNSVPSERGESGGGRVVQQDRLICGNDSGNTTNNNNNNNHNNHNNSGGTTCEF